MCAADVASGFEFLLGLTFTKANTCRHRTEMIPA